MHSKQLSTAEIELLEKLMEEVSRLNDEIIDAGMNGNLYLKAQLENQRREMIRQINELLNSN